MILVTLAAACPALARGTGLARFVARQRPCEGRACYVAGLRVPRFAARLAGQLGLGRHVRERRLLQVTNRSLDAFTRATARGYLEVVVPASTGHVFFRHGDRVYDFYQGGFRTGGVRAIQRERYGMLIKLTRGQERRLTSYLDRLERTGGKELGPYDFHGREGFHCVSWLLRQPLDRRGNNLLGLLGGDSARRPGMPGFSRFLLKRARPLEAVVLYSDARRSPSALSRARFKLMSNRQIVRQFRREQRAARHAPADRGPGSGR